MSKPSEYAAIEDACEALTVDNAYIMSRPGDADKFGNVKFAKCVKEVTSATKKIMGGQISSRHTTDTHTTHFAERGGSGSHAIFRPHQHRHLSTPPGFVRFQQEEKG